MGTPKRKHEVSSAEIMANIERGKAERDAFTAWIKELRDEYPTFVRDVMRELVLTCRKRALRHGETDHWQCCKTVADTYNLWNKDDRFPRWLSRVVEGVLRDIEENPNDKEV